MFAKTMLNNIFDRISRVLPVWSVRNAVNCLWTEPPAQNILEILAEHHRLFGLKIKSGGLQECIQMPCEQIAVRQHVRICMQQIVRSAETDFR